MAGSWANWSPPAESPPAVAPLLPPGSEPELSTPEERLNDLERSASILGKQIADLSAQARMHEDRLTEAERHLSVIEGFLNHFQRCLASLLGFRRD